MENVFNVSLIVLSFCSLVQARSPMSEMRDTKEPRQTISDLDKTTELCRSISTSMKLDCAEASKKCMSETTYEDKMACLEKQVK